MSGQVSISFATKIELVGSLEEHSLDFVSWTLARLSSTNIAGFSNEYRHLSVFATLAFDVCDTLLSSRLS